MKLNTVRRLATVALTAVLLTAAGQGVAVASDPQWESWESMPPAATQP